MCEFCGSTEENKMARAGADRMANDLNRLAHHYAALSCGRILPHTDEMKKPQSLANSLIRRLVEDWV